MTKPKEWYESGLPLSPESEKHVRDIRIAVEVETRVASYAWPMLELLKAYVKDDVCFYVDGCSGRRSLCRYCEAMVVIAKAEGRK